MDLQSFDELSEARRSYDTIEARGPSRPRGHAWLAWIAIFATVGFATWLHTRGDHDEADEPSIVIPEIQAKYLVGAAGMLFSSKESSEDQIDLVFDHGPLRQRLMGIVLTGELVGPQSAMKKLDDLKNEIENEPDTEGEPDDEASILLRKIFEARIDKRDVTANLSDEEQQTAQQLLPERLGWTGRLALLPPGSSDQVGRSKLLSQARRTLIVILGVSAVGVSAMAVGTILQIVWWIFAAMGRLTPGIPPLRGEQRIYAETFAVWMALYLALSVLISQRPFRELGLIAVAIPQIGSLIALGWPILRGLQWSDVRTDLGLYWGPQGWAAPFVGLATYLSALPLVGMAMIVTLIMMQIASLFVAGGDSSVSTPVHPIVEPILRGSWTVRMQLLFVAAFASVPEEIMFRGVLFRHLREAGTRFGYHFSVILAALISSFIFAAIHPQGLFGIPILMTLAMVFAIVREWRGSIVPSIVAHALVNIGTTVILLLIAD